MQIGLNWSEGICHNFLTFQMMKSLRYYQKMKMQFLVIMKEL